jgi:hypothetical protein
MLRRKGAEFLYFWEKHPGGHGWHLHWVTNKYLSLGGGDERTDFRAWMVKRGWGAIMKVKRVEASPARFNGQTWVSDESNVRAVVLYLVKYVTKCCVDDNGLKKKSFGASARTKLGTVAFSWCKWINPTTYLYRYGKSMWLDLYGTLPTFKDFAMVVRLGVEDTNWLEIDPWWMPSGP